MKKIFIFLSIIIFVYFIFNQKEEDIVIPSEAIRFRVLANSNSIEDQNIKQLVRDNVEKVIYDLLVDVSNIQDVRNIISKNLETIDYAINEVTKNQSYGYEVNFGYNYFPAKEYNGIIYEAGNYESLLITLGSGEGDNWWCVLFPPFCLLEAEEGTEVEYKFLIQELIDKYF